MYIHERKILNPGWCIVFDLYLCIKQALFIRPMNMHCLVAVARCRVQTRRYHWLINHTQFSHTPLSPSLFHPVPYFSFIPHYTYTHSLTHSLIAYSPFHFASCRTFGGGRPRARDRSHPAVRPCHLSGSRGRPQLTLIYVIFSWPAHVTIVISSFTILFYVSSFLVSFYSALFLLYRFSTLPCHQTNFKLI